MTKKFHTESALARITERPISPDEMPAVVNSLVWDGDRAIAYWLAEEMIVHPRVRELSRADHWTPYSVDWWRGVWQTLGGIVTLAQKKRLPPAALDRQEAEREARKARSSNLTLVSLAVTIVALALAGCASEPASGTLTVCPSSGFSVQCEPSGVCVVDGATCCGYPAAGEQLDERCMLRTCPVDPGVTLPCTDDGVCERYHNGATNECCGAPAPGVELNERCLLPHCTTIGAPESLLCTSDGVCSWEGRPCCMSAAVGRPVNERCEFREVMP